jgi:beta-lactamase superfamily II metal-dependent hydrolase
VSLPRCRADLCSVVVFGPGFGESVVIRVPPDSCIVVDSLRHDAGGRRVNPALQLVDRWSARIDLLVLTHPHADHAAGFGDLVDAAGEAILACADTFVSDREHWRKARRDKTDGERTAGRTEQALSAIDTRWSTSPEEKIWRLEAGQCRSVGEATVEALFPDVEALEGAAASAQPDPNACSTPLVLRWREAMIVLAADVDTESAWDRILGASRSRPLADHHVLKIAHHGSVEA